MSRTEEILDEVQAQCRERGVRLTAKRQHVLSTLIESGAALSAYELADLCNEGEEHAIPVMSVYRILEFFQQEQFVHKLHVANKFIACSHIVCDHDHGVSQFLICSRCHDVSEILVENKVMNALEQTVRDAGYTMLAPQLEMNCLCSNCATAA